MIISSIRNHFAKQNQKFVNRLHSRRVLSTKWNYGQSNSKRPFLAPFKVYYDFSMGMSNFDTFGNLVDDSGSRVWSSEYYEARKAATDHATKRGQHYEEAKKAFDRGDKKLAKELSELGKKEGVMMEKANERAVQEILKKQDLLNSDTVDLHGLLVAEAVTVTEEFANRWLGKKPYVQIITGAGKHSSAGALIRPAIVKLCQEKKWVLEPIPGNDGSFVLTF